MKKVVIAIVIGFFACMSSIWWIETNSLKKEISSRLYCDSIACKGFPFSPKVECRNLRTKDGRIEHEGLACFGVSFLGNHGWLDLFGKVTIDQNLAFSGIIAIENVPFSDWHNNLLKNLSFHSRDLSISFQNATVFEAKKMNIELLDSSRFAADILGGRILTSATQIFPQNSTDIQLEGNWTYTDKTFPFYFEIERYIAKDNYSSGEGNTKFTIDTDQNDLLQMSVFFSSEQVCHTLLAVPEQDWVIDALNPIFLQYPLIEKICLDHWDEIETLIPNTLGKTKKELKAQFKLCRLPNQVLQLEKLILERLHFENDRYEIDLKGEISDVREAIYALELTLKNHQAALNELAGYYNRWQTLLSSPDLFGSTLFRVNEKMISKIGLFLESLSDSRSEKEVTLSFKGTKPFPFSIGSQTPEQLNEKLNQLSQDLIAEIRSEIPIAPKT